ncbi:hypothetical protein A5N82_13270 [Christensenella minuta]|nr:N-acetylmuramoyl-L-alanine amidase [Christensenella minuta]AYH39012.1 N-acetylmuramoyl-L-alanine amidase [Christensenella minuta]OAQ39019.1 hypothetical protein A5N82_13270 [Christensenella minuta]
MKIYINPGHGGSDSGAAAFGRTEKADNLRYASAVADKLKAAGHTVELERNADYLIPVKDIAKNANLWGADLFIAFHRNAGGGEGVECLIVSTASETSRNMAQAIQNALLGVGFRDRGVKVQDRNTYVLSHTTMPATTIECGFIDNENDNALFDAKFNEIVQGITDAILSIAGGSAPSTPAPQPTAPAQDVPTLTRNLRNGSRGEDVRQAQARLNRHKANAGKEDGVFGSNTEAAVRRFQRARKNEGRDIGKVDGVIGSKTWAILWE